MPSATSAAFFLPSSSHGFHQQPPTGSKSLFGSIKEKLARKSSTSEHRSSSFNPFTANSAPSYSPGRTTSSGTTPTRRPPPAEAPPAYSESPIIYTGAGSVTRASSPSPSVISTTSLATPEDPYAFLTTFDTIFVIDDSGSMVDRLRGTNNNAWGEVKDTLATIAPICTARDSDGIDIYFLNHQSKSPAILSKGAAAGGYCGITNANEVHRLFSTINPRGATPTGITLRKILKPYLQLCHDRRHNLEAVRPINIIVITDGAASDDVEGVLIHAAEKLDKIDAPPYQVGVQFFQVGNQPGATEALRELDDGLCKQTQAGIRDMVDTVTWSRKNGQQTVLNADDILKTVLGAVIKRLDRRPVGGRRASAQHLAP